MSLKKICLAAFVASAMVGSLASANEWVVSDAMQGKGGATVFNVGFAGDGEVMDAQIDLNYDGEAFVANVQAVNGGSCSVHPKGGVVRVLTPESNQPLSDKVMALCNITFVAKGSAKSQPSLSVGSSECSRGMGKSAGCDLSSAAETVK